MIGRMLTRSQDLLQCLFSKCASTSLVCSNRWWGKSFEQAGVCRRVPPKGRPCSKHYTSLMGGLYCLGLDIWTSTLRHLLCCWKTSQGCPPPVASEYEARLVLRKSSTHNPGTQLQRVDCREREGERREGKARAEGRWLRCLCQRAFESILSLFVYNWSCGVWCSATQNCNNSPFYDVVLTFPKLGRWPGTDLTYDLLCCWVHATLQILLYVL